MTGTTLLHPRDPFPALVVNLPGGRALHLPGDLAGRFGVVLLYRGARYPYCNAQLSAFQRVPDGLAEVDACSHHHVPRPGRRPGLARPGHHTSTTVRATAKTQLSRQGVPHGTATA